VVLELLELIGLKTDFSVYTYKNIGYQIFITSKIGIDKFKGPV